MSGGVDRKDNRPNTNGTKVSRRDFLKLGLTAGLTAVGLAVGLKLTKIQGECTEAPNLDQEVAYFLEETIGRKKNNYTDGSQTRILKAAVDNAYGQNNGGSGWDSFIGLYFDRRNSYRTNGYINEETTKYLQSIAYKYRDRPDEAWKEMVKELIKKNEEQLGSAVDDFGTDKLNTMWALLPGVTRTQNIPLLRATELFTALSTEGSEDLERKANKIIDELGITSRIPFSAYVLFDPEIKNDPALFCYYTAIYCLSIATLNPSIILHTQTSKG